MRVLFERVFSFVRVSLWRVISRTCVGVRMRGFLLACVIVCALFLLVCATSCAALLCLCVLRGRVRASWHIGARGLGLSRACNLFSHTFLCVVAWLVYRVCYCLRVLYSRVCSCVYMCSGAGRVLCSCVLARVGARRGMCASFAHGRACSITGRRYCALGPKLCKLTWLVLGKDPAACSRRAEQFTAL